MWQEYLDNEMNTANKTDYYFAQIAAEIRRSFTKNPEKVSLKEFLNPVKFVRNAKKKLDQRVELNREKSAWFSLTGYGKFKKGK